MNKTTTKPKLQCHIRGMIRKDMNRVLEIESNNFEFPWSEEQFIRCLRQRNCIGMVAEHGPPKDMKVVGYMIYELHRTRLHLLNFSADSTLHRQGIGSAMIGKLKDKLSNQRRSRILLEVRETNLDALLFLRSQGFRAISVLRNYYEDTDDDAILMQYRVPLMRPS